MLSYLQENDAAGREYQRVLELWPDCSAGLWLYAELLSSTGKDRAKARRLLDKALKIDSEDAIAYFYLGLHLLRLHRKSKARDALSKAAELGHAKAQELLSES
jgi:tetratricopeptide (TPR) repeat protein